MQSSPLLATIPTMDINPVSTDAVKRSHSKSRTGVMPKAAAAAEAWAERVWTDSRRVDYTGRWRPYEHAPPFVVENCTRLWFNAASNQMTVDQFLTDVMRVVVYIAPQNEINRLRDAAKLGDEKASPPLPGSNALKKEKRNLPTNSEQAVPVPIYGASWLPSSLAWEQLGVFYAQIFELKWAATVHFPLDALKARIDGKALAPMAFSRSESDIAAVDSFLRDVVKIAAIEYARKRDAIVKCSESILYKTSVWKDFHRLYTIVTGKQTFPCFNTEGELILFDIGEIYPGVQEDDDRRYAHSKANSSSNGQSTTTVQAMSTPCYFPFSSTAPTTTTIGYVPLPILNQFGDPPTSPLRPRGVPSCFSPPQPESPSY